MLSIAAAAVNRRSFLFGTTGAALAASLPITAAGAAAVKEFTLIAAPGRAPIAGGSHPPTEVWS